ncbi:DUF4012 domain-containing protein [Patescibacteria group bacterium]
MESEHRKEEQEKCQEPDCLNLRSVQEERQAQILRSAKDLVDLSKLGKKEQAWQVEQQRQEKDRAREAAQNLLDLTRQAEEADQADPRKRVLAVPKQESTFEPAALEPAIPSLSEKPTLVSEPIAPLGGDIAETFPEYFTISRADSLAVEESLAPSLDTAAEVAAGSEISHRIDFLHPALEMPAVKTKARSVKVKPKNIALTQKVVTAMRAQRPRRRSLVVFALLAVFLTGAIGASAAVQRTLDSQDDILVKATQGAASLQSAAGYLKQQNFLQAITDFERSAKFFAEAQADIDQIGDVTSQLLVLVPKGRAAVSLIEAGQAMSESGQAFAKAVGYFRQVGSIFASEENSDDNPLSLAEALLASQQEFNEVAAKLDIAKQNLDKVDVDQLPADFQSELIEAKEILAILQGTTNYFQNFAGQMSEIMGAKGPKRYLILLTNSDEMRGSIGGFPGSYMILNFADGRIKSLEFNDIYEIRGQQNELIIPPQPFQLITGNLEAHDVAGWPIDYRDSAAKVMEYYQMSAGGTTVDGVWTLGSGIIPDLLAITGPIKLPEFDMTVTQENYLELLETEVESDEARQTGEPKKVVESLITKILAQIFDKKNVDWLQLMGILNQAIAKKELQLHFTQDDLEDFAIANNAAGNIEEADDYLAVFSYNIGGGKTDTKISENIEHVASINNEGDLEGVVKINRALRSPEDLDKLSRVKNVSWLKVVLPANAEILKVKGEDVLYPIKYQPPREARPDQELSVIETQATKLNNGRVTVSHEAGKKVVGFWLGIEPGKEKTVEISYRTNDVLDLEGFLNEAAGYTSIIQTQPGKSNVHIASRVTFPNRTNIAWQEASGAFVNSFGQSLSWTVDNPAGDIVVSAVIDKQ